MQSVRIDSRSGLPRYFIHNADGPGNGRGNRPTQKAELAVWEPNNDGVVSDSAQCARIAGRQLWLGVVCMVLIANLQYGWTLFVNPMNKTARLRASAPSRSPSRSSSRPKTWLTPIQGWIVDRTGAAPRPADHDRLSAASWSASPGSSTPTPTSLTRALSRRRGLGHRRRRDLRDLRGQRGEVVPRPARPRGRPDRRRVSAPARRSPSSRSA